MIHYFDFEQGKAGEIPVLVPVTDATEWEVSKLVHVVLITPKGLLQILTLRSFLEGRKEGCRVNVVFDPEQRKILIDSGWGDPGLELPGIAEKWFKVKAV